MSQIPDRDALEARLGKLLGTHFRRTGQTIIELLGDPPNVANIPSDFWDGVGKEAQQVVRPRLEEIYLEAASRLHDESPIKVDWAGVNEVAADWAGRYSFDLVTGINTTSRDRLQQAVGAYYRDTQTIGELEAGLAQYKEFTARAGRLFGPARVAVIATTEVTRAASEGERGMVAELEKEGVTLQPVWLTSNDEIVRRCPICWPRHEQPITDGVYPPGHPGCRCWVGHEFVAEEVLPAEEAAKPVVTDWRKQPTETTTAGTKPDYEVNARHIMPVNPVADLAKMEAIAHSMEKEGWKGDPVLAYYAGDNLQALTGSHRIHAAIEAGVDVPVSIVDLSRFDKFDLQQLQDIRGDDERLIFLQDLGERGIVPQSQVAIMEAEMKYNEANWNTDYSELAQQRRLEQAEEYASMKPAQREKEKKVNTEAKYHLESFLDAMKEKYTNIWAEMSDEEMDTYDRLEAETYR